MTNRDFEILYKKICRSVHEKELSNALVYLKTLASELGNPYFSDQREELETTYKNLLGYTINNIVDPERDKIYNQIQIKTMELADTIRDAFFSKNSDNIVYQLKRFNSDQFFIPNASQYETSEHFSKTFKRLWLSDKYETELQQALKELYASQKISSTEKAAWISASTLSLLRTFDEAKFNFLLDLLDNCDKRVRQRALVGLIFCAQTHHNRISIYHKLESRFDYTFQNESLAENLQKTIILILLSNETEKISKKMKEAIPDIIKQNQTQRQQLTQKDLEELLDEDGGMDATNPKWKSLLENSALSEKAREISEFQLEGGDIFMGTFSQMKKHPFFNNIENWFLPFFNHDIYRQFSSQEVINNNSGLIQIVEQSQFLCDSDKYSMLNSIADIPAQYKEMLTNTLKIEREHIKESVDTTTNASQEAIALSKNYIQDLFRFYNLYGYKGDFSNPFLQLKELHANRILQSNPQSESILRAVCDYYIKKEHYQLANHLLKTLMEKNPSDAELMQKAAYCHQQQKEYTEALQLYEKAETLLPDTTWNAERIAFCQKRLGNYEASLEAYRQCERMQPDNLNIQSNIGHCLIHLGRHEEALKVFYKIDYLSPDNPKSAKAIGWCSFVCQKLETAEKYYKKSLPEKRNANDWMNIGHILFCQNKKEEAIPYYKKAFEKLEHNPQKFIELFLEDTETLRVNGVPTEDLPLIRDYLIFQCQ